jgi:hypothetical protein
MRWIAWLACVALASCTFPPSSNTTTSTGGPDPNSPYLTISGGSLSYHGRAVTLRGENFNNEPALACCGEADINRINVNAQDYANVANTLGGNYVRLGLEYGWYKADKLTFFQVIDRHVQWAKQNHLWLVPVIFGPPGGSHGDYSGQEGFWDSATNQQDLTAFWSDFATHYAVEATVAGYDLFNEPAPPSALDWKAWAQATTDAVTKVDANHFVVLEQTSADWSLPAVSAPRILWSSHCYARAGSEGCNFPGPNHASPTDRPFLVGEVGTKTKSTGLSYVPGDLDAFNRDGVSWTHFLLREPDDGFGLYANNGAGDFSQPQTTMIDTVSQAMKGSVRPG